MKKIITYERFPSASLSPIIRITEQSHRGREFGYKCEVFRSNDNVYLISLDSPRWGRLGRVGAYIYVRGENIKKDDDLLVFPNYAIFKGFELAVEQYNNTEFKFDSGMY